MMKTPAKSREQRNEKRSKNRRKKATVSYPITHFGWLLKNRVDALLTIYVVARQIIY